MAKCSYQDSYTGQMVPHLYYGHAGIQTHTHTHTHTQHNDLTSLLLFFLWKRVMLSSVFISNRFGIDCDMSYSAIHEQCSRKISVKKIHYS